MPAKTLRHKQLKLAKNKMVAGVCAGIAEYLEIDPTVVRLAVVVGTLFTGFFPGMILYLIATFLIPE